MSRTDMHWSVTVSRDGERVVTIETNCLSGREPDAADEAAIRTAATHLLSFLGDGLGADATEANRLLAAVRKVRDGYADQARDADHEPAAYFREFVRRLDIACEVTK